MLQIFSFFLGVPNNAAVEAIKAWNEMIKLTEKKYEKLDPYRLGRKESNEIYGEFMRKVCKVTETNEFYVEYITQVRNISLMEII